MSALAIRGGTPVRAQPWPEWPDPRAEDARAVAEVVASGKWWQYAGEHTVAFERGFAAYQGAAYGVTVNSGTTALHVALLALGIGPGDEVIVPAYTFQATATAVLLANAVPVFADVLPETMNLDPDSVAAAITPRTRALIPVHFAGLPADMARLGALAKAHGLFMLEDAAQAHGAVWQGRKAGSIGNAGAFSFQASKNLCAGEGGFVTTSDEAVAAKAAAIRDCGRAAGPSAGDRPLVGYSFRMTEMQSVLLRTRLAHLEEETARRYRNGRRLTTHLAQLPGATPLDPEPGAGDRRAYHLYAVRMHPEELGVSRDQFLTALNAEGIPARPGYTRALSQDPAFLDCPRVSCPVAEQLCQEVMWLFHTLFLGDEKDVDDIARAFERVVEHRTELA